MDRSPCTFTTIFPNASRHLLKSFRMLRHARICFAAISIALNEKSASSSNSQGRLRTLSNHKSLQTHAFQCPQANYHSYARVIICRSRR
eukprot:UN0310